MKTKFTKILVPAFLLIVTGLFAYSFFYLPTGFTGTTKKGGTGTGCDCHRDTATTSVSVFFQGPDSVAAGQTVTYKIFASHGPAVIGGFNVASFRAGLEDTITLAPVPGDTMVRKQDGELTHTQPKQYANDSVFWTFTYKASNTLGWDTLYATSNSANGNGSFEGDYWNWSPNKPIKIYQPIGITNISSIAETFELGQNYPNPFNPVTQISFSVAKAGDIKIKIFDLLGNEVVVLVDQKLSAGKYKTDFSAANFSSGAYFYSLYADGKLLSTKRMLLLK
ncbi:MAG: T9SS type A sorting domain-containing protein [Ignavibacteria bacterium]|nr:T9SS type A sorting domain-containing protein [Ignavibacteria bacterium]